MSAASYVELGIVIDRAKDQFVSGRVDALIEQAEINIVSLTEAQARIARSAYQRFGKGSGHPANLNFGDCFSYALAMELDHPLLFKGRDFAQTDVAPALT